MYAAKVDGRRLTFEVSAVWRRNMIVRDRETGTLWQHATGEGLIGPLKGARLTPLGAEQMTWRAWRTEYPDTEVAAGPEKWPGLVPRPVVERVLSFATHADRANAPGLQPLDRRLPQAEPVAGLVVGGEARAYPLSLLREQNVVSDTLGGVPVAVIYEPAAVRLRALQRRVDGRTTVLEMADSTLVDVEGMGAWTTSGEPVSGTSAPLSRLAVTRQRWLGWSEFHPASSIYRGTATTSNGSAGSRSRTADRQ